MLLIDSDSPPLLPPYHDDQHEYVNTPQGPHTPQADELPPGPVINYAVLDLPPPDVTQNSLNNSPVLGAVGGVVSALSTTNHSSVEVVDVLDTKVLFKLPVYGSGGGDSLLERRLSSNAMKRAREQQHSYANQSSHAYANHSPQTSKSSHEYQNVDLCPDRGVLPGKPVPSTSAHTSPACTPSSPLSLPPSNPDSPSRRADSPSRRGDSYTTIDFDRTAALLNSSKNVHKAEWREEDGVRRTTENGIRKTRHDEVPDCGNGD